MILGISLLHNTYMDEVDRRPFYTCNTEVEQRVLTFHEYLSTKITTHWLNRIEDWLSHKIAADTLRIVKPERAQLPPWPGEDA